MVPLLRARPEDIPLLVWTFVRESAQAQGKTIEEVRWRIWGEGGAAQRLGLKPTTLESRMRKAGIKRA